jgi:hypothetical protein
VKILTNIPGVTVPEAEALIVFAETTNVLPEFKLLLLTIKFGFIVYADVVYNVFPVKNPLGAAELYMLSTNEESNGIPNVLPDVESTNIGYLTFNRLNSGTGVLLSALYCGIKTLRLL